MVHEVRKTDTSERQHGGQEHDEEVGFRMMRFAVEDVGCVAIMHEWRANETGEDGKYGKDDEWHGHDLWRFMKVAVRVWFSPKKVRKMRRNMQNAVINATISAMTK